MALGLRQSVYTLALIANRLNAWLVTKASYPNIKSGHESFNFRTKNSYPRGAANLTTCLLHSRQCVFSASIAEANTPAMA
jgi:hypothetical protein